MTLDEYKQILADVHNDIVDHLAKAESLRDNSVSTDDQREGRRKAEVFSAKLDLIKWIMDRAEKIEITKPKMREFL